MYAPLCCARACAERARNNEQTSQELCAETALLRPSTDQAAIAVDNARLLREIEERNNDLSESLELQTATSEVLQLISANPGDLTVVLEGIVTRAAALCGAEPPPVGEPHVLRRGSVPQGTHTTITCVCAHAYMCVIEREIER